jgi:hypothetical protein
MNEPHPETLFHQSVTRKIELIEIMLAQRPRRVRSKPARRSTNWRQDHITKMTNLLQHRKSCIQGYRAKKLLEENGRGHNTTSGIPEIFLTLV